MKGDYLEYKGFYGEIELCSREKIFRGKLVVLPLFTFQGTNIDDLERDFQKTVDYYLSDCAKHGVEPRKPFSGNFIVRVSPEMHFKIAQQADKENKSLNAWVIEKLKEATQS